MSKMITLKIRIERETEKAIKGHVQGIGTCWLPKSQIKINEDTVEVPEWLAAAKQNEVFENCGRSYTAHKPVAKRYAENNVI